MELSVEELLEQEERKANLRAQEVKEELARREANERRDPRRRDRHFDGKDYEPMDMDDRDDGVRIKNEPVSDDNIVKPYISNPNRLSDVNIKKEGEEERKPSTLR